LVGRLRALGFAAVAAAGSPKQARIGC